MKKIYNIFSAFLLLLLTGSVLASCSDDKLELPGDPEITIGGDSDFDGYSINFTATLDRMGGKAGSRDLSDEKLTEMENFIDLEKFRVLFFTCETDKDGKPHDYFLFESKSRRVRNMGGNKWLISVPLYTSGNDIYEDRTPKEYNWKAIREYLTTDSFKIAILANRPEEDFYPGYDSIRGGMVGDYFDNRAPFWYPEHSVASGAEATKVMDVFDLHHCQYDPIYKGKSYMAKDTNNGVSDDTYGYYGFIMGNDGPPSDPDGGDEDYWEANYNKVSYQPTLSPTSSWIETDDSKNLLYGSNYRRFTVLPSLTNPIPMYGIQRYEKIPAEHWKEGTPFNVCSEINDGLSISSYTGKPVSLLRSVVRVDLYLPKDSVYQPKYVGLAYVNVNNRCEPMDVWTPTDELWERQHTAGNASLLGENAACVEYNSILNYGPISSATTKAINNTSVVQRFQKAIGWFYGCWLEKNWDFGDSEVKSYIEGQVDKVVNGRKNSPPRIFNPCTQRNNMIILDWVDSPKPNCVGNVTEEGDNSYHYVAYIGERNINDPSKLGVLDQDGAGNSTIGYWVIEQNGLLYALPLVDYGKAGNDVLNNINGKGGSTAPQNYGTLYNANAFAAELNAQVNPYANKVKDTNASSGFANKPNSLPYPLIRNHVYKFKFKHNKPISKADGKPLEYTVTSGDYHSKTL